MVKNESDFEAHKIPKPRHCGIDAIFAAIRHFDTQHYEVGHDARAAPFPFFPRRRLHRFDCCGWLCRQRY